jgi:2-oxoglutarate ferredoxin oxidoreductase subunit alpha
MEKVIIGLQLKYARLRKEVRFEALHTEDADILLVAFGLSARICQKALELARAQGINVGLFRPITLYPFPSEALAEHASRASSLLTVEMNSGQMVEDVRLAVNGQRPVHFTGRMGGMIPSPEDVLKQIEILAADRAVVEERN